MKRVRFVRGFELLLVGGVMLQFGGCVGPNPGFFISTSVANASIMNIVSALFNTLLQSG